jgi:hypothetical protein
MDIDGTRRVRRAEKKAGKAARAERALDAAHRASKPHVKESVQQTLTDALRREKEETVRRWKDLILKHDILGVCDSEGEEY